MKLNEENLQEIVFNDIISNQYEQEKISFSHQNTLGNFSVESMKIGESILMKWLSSFTQDTVIYGTVEIPTVRLSFLNQSKRGVYLGTNQLKLQSKQGTFNALFVSDNFWGYDMFHKQEHTALSSVIISQEHFLKLASEYPEVFEKLSERYQKERNFMLFDDCCPPISFEMNTILQQLENAPLMGCASGVYADLKTIELLLQMSQIENQFPKTFSHCKTSADIDKLHEAKRLLVQDLLSTPSLTELSKLVGLNEKKLKCGFKEMFGTTVFGYLFDYKMQLAKQYLLDTEKPISEVALLCGYEYVSHFSTAFKRKYGFSPLEMRR